MHVVYVFVVPLLTRRRTIIRRSFALNTAHRRDIVNSRSSHNTLIVRLTRRIRSSLLILLIRITNKLVNRGRLQIISRHAHSTRTLLLTTKRLTQRVIDTILRASLLRHLGNLLLISSQVMMLHSRRILSNHRIQRRVRLLRRRTSRILTRINRLTNIRVLRLTTLRQGKTLTQHIRTTSRIRRHHLTKAQQTSSNRPFTLQGNRTRVVSHVRITMSLKGVVRFGRRVRSCSLAVPAVPHTTQPQNQYT